MVIRRSIKKSRRTRRTKRTRRTRSKFGINWHKFLPDIEGVTRPQQQPQRQPMPQRPRLERDETGVDPSDIVRPPLLRGGRPDRHLVHKPNHR